METTRRAFLEQVGQGVLIASIGSGLTRDLGLGSAEAAEGPARLTFGKSEPLVQLLQDAPADKLLPILAARLEKGTELKELVAAAALANARFFGGQDYVGYHTMMALAPAYAMAKELPEDRQALPVFKVLYRNSSRIKERGGKETLGPVEPAKLEKGTAGGAALRKNVRAKDHKAAETAFAALSKDGYRGAYNDLIEVVQDETEVHRVVLAYRAYDMIDVVGKEQAQVLLRQSVRYCVDAERANRWVKHGDCRKVLPNVLEKHKLPLKMAGKRKLDDAGLERLAQDIFKATPEQAAGLAAEALADGILPDNVGEAITLAACELILRDDGRPKNQTSKGKPEGSVHGDSIGVHGLDSANAWRNIARITNARNQAACLILGAFQVALDRAARGGDFLKWKAYPRPEHTEKVKAKEAADLLREAEAAIKSKEQGRTAACIAKYLADGNADKDVFALLLRYSISEDGALHAEKFYRTTREEHARTRQAFRNRYLVGLARVAASAYGQPAPGHAEACKLLKL
jgi:hypothetical protein